MTKKEMLRIEINNSILRRNFAVALSLNENEDVSLRVILTIPYEQLKSKWEWIDEHFDDSLHMIEDNSLSISSVCPVFQNMSYNDLNYDLDMNTFNDEVYKQ